jgi:predicted TIM-barrel fold metal-dependent hydrolase
MDFSHITLFDHHCHPLRRPAPLPDGLSFRRYFAESGEPNMKTHIPYNLFYRRGLRDLADLLDCAPTEEAVVAARQRFPPEHYARHLFNQANVRMLAVDTGIHSVEDYTLVEQRAFLPCQIAETLRLEALVERLALETESFAQFEDAFRSTLDDVRSRGIVAFKSIAAARGGLQLRPLARSEAAAGFAVMKELSRRVGPVRLEDRALLEYTLLIGLEAAATQELPVQFHTGFGDRDVDLRDANPLHLRPLFEDETLRGATFVLLHTYPFMREAGYLASVYSQVYVDLSQTIPFAAHGGAHALLQVLELAPTSKVLLATNAGGIPDLFYLGAWYLRHNLGVALTQLHAQGWVTHQQAEQTASQMLYHNAAALYGMG